MQCLPIFRRTRPNHILVFLSRFGLTRRSESQESGINHGSRLRKFISHRHCQFRAQNKNFYCNLTNCTEINRAHVGGNVYLNRDDHEVCAKVVCLTFDLQRKTKDEVDCSLSSKKAYAISSFLALKGQRRCREASIWTKKVVQTVSDKYENVCTLCVQ